MTTAVRGDVAWVSIPRLVELSAQRFADLEAVVDGDQRVTYAELSQRVRGCAGGIIRAGVQPGERVAIWAPNSLEWVIAALGALCAGAALVPVNTRFKGEEAGYVLAKSRAVLAFVGAPFLGMDYSAMLADQRAELAELASVVRLDAAGLAHFGTDPGATAIDRRINAVGGDDISDVIFTSGTTGRPKGVVCTHAQSLRVFDTWAEVVGLRAGDRYLVVNPFFHTFGYKAGILACLMRGATVVPMAVFDAPAVLAQVERERITVLPGPPTLYSSILDAPDRDGRDLSSLRLAVTGAAVVPVALIERMREELTFSTVLTAYGLTECTGTASMCRPEDDAITIAETSGRAIPDTELAVVGADGAPLPPGEPGEVVTRGYHVMRGYFEDPEATAAAIDADGWLHTGDIGVMDERGYLRITDRLKDMYVVGGFNAYPAEIEQMLARHPGIAESAVVGLPDPRLGEVGKAYVVPRPGAEINALEVITWCRERMANYKVPREVAVVDSLPRNASGKVLKYRLRAHG